MVQLYSIWRKKNMLNNMHNIILTTQNSTRKISPYIIQIYRYLWNGLQLQNVNLLFDTSPNIEIFGTVTYFEKQKICMTIFRWRYLFFSPSFFWRWMVGICIGILLELVLHKEKFGATEPSQAKSWLDPTLDQFVNV